MGLVEKSEFLHYNRKKEKRVKSECDLLRNFYFSKHDFCLVEWKSYYFVCVIHNGELISVWNCKSIEEGFKNLPGEVMGIFRKEYQKHNITEEQLNLFIENPLEYERRYRL